MGNTRASRLRWRNYALAESGARLLVVDDSKVNRLLAFAQSGTAGYRVVTAENGRVAPEVLRREAFDLLHHFGTGTIRSRAIVPADSTREVGMAERAGARRDGRNPAAARPCGLA